MQANAIGRSSKTVREFLEKNHKDDLSREETIKLTVKSLLEVVQTGAKNIEISVMESYGKVTVSFKLSVPRIVPSHSMLQSLDLSEIEAIVAEIEKEKEAGSLQSSIPPNVALTLRDRGRAKALKTGSNCCGSGRHDPARRRKLVLIHSRIAFKSCQIRGRYRVQYRCNSNPPTNACHPWHQHPERSSLVYIYPGSETQLEEDAYKTRYLPIPPETNNYISLIQR